MRAAVHGIQVANARMISQWVSPYLGLVAVVVLLIYALVWRSYISRRSMKNLADSRAGYSQQSFILELKTNAVSEEVAYAVGERFRAWASCKVENFPIMPSDPLTLFLPIVDYDLEEVLDDILTTTGRQWNNARFPITYQNTIADVAQFVARCELKQSV